MRIDALDHLAVKLEHKAQHAMRRRMLRPEVDREVAEVLVGHWAPRNFSRGGGIREWRMASRELVPVITLTLVPTPRSCSEAIE